MSLYSDILQSQKRQEGVENLNVALRAALALDQLALGVSLWDQFFAQQWHVAPDLLSYSFRARISAKMNNPEDFIKYVRTAIPDVGSKPVDSLLLRTFYGSLIDFGTGSWDLN